MATIAPKQPPVFNLPNQLTAARLVLGIVLFVFIDQGMWIGSIIVFALAAITDWLDGYLARRQGLVSTLGRNLDPLVDKVVVCGAYIFLLPVRDSGLAAWMVTVVVGRELIITGLRSFMEMSGAHFGADWLGKIKMVLQCTTLFLIFAYLARAEALGTPPEIGWELIRDISIYAMLVATALSGLQYVWRAFQMLKPENL
ncbi:MAG TPA: CDP-diacylglycerol--glycerol-3-phosphate 3-phosphatidyltransferase [Gemmataceae bacterium]|nr:CDP-diacylglycerol--glycerol-3-phosphate 3-phosphatidyltransferase [Gemmataceae bacterium]